MTRYTSRDAARLAGVSQSTVSYVMSGKRPIGESTRRRVLAAMDQLEYQPNASARALAEHRTSLVGLMIPFGAVVDTPALMPFIETITSLARANDYDVILVGSDEGPDGLRRLAGRALCDGIVVMNVERADERVTVAASLPVPVVFIGVPDGPAGVHCVDLDFAAAGRLAVEELWSTGHERLLIVEHSAEMMTRRLSFVDRLLGAASGAAARYGIGYAVLTPPAAGRAGVVAVADRVLEDYAAGRLGVLVANTQMVQPVVHELAARGVIPGQELSVIGVCTDAEAAESSPPVTNVSLEPRDVSRRAMATMFRLLGSQNKPAVPVVDLISPRLTRRDTVMPTPGQRGNAGPDKERAVK